MTQETGAGMPDKPVFVLIRPQMGENIGAAARAMLNFGLDQMRITDPRDGWPNPRAVAMASGAAARVLDSARIYADTGAALGDFDYVFATTARDRSLTKPVMTPEHAMREARRRIASGQRVGVMFGPERAGLENDDIVYANAIISVPVNPEFPSLNLGQAVLLTAYEWARETIEVLPERMEFAGTEYATRIELDKLAEHYEAELDRTGFFFPPSKAPGMQQNLRNMWFRLGLTRSEVQTLHGLLRQLIRGKRD